VERTFVVTIFNVGGVARIEEDFEDFFVGVVWGDYGI
jgi:hypothetical protein